MEFWVQVAAFVAGAMSMASIAIAVHAYQDAKRQGKFVSKNRTINGDMTGGTYSVGNINISGRSFSGSNIAIINDRIYVDGVDVTNQDGKPATGIVKIEVTGDVNVVNCDRALDIKGNVTGGAKSGGSLNCGDITGNAESNGSMNAGHIGGNARSGGSMNCGKVAGSVQAGGSVRHG